jgi:hypothetical protein
MVYSSLHWRLKALAGVLCLLLALNTLVIAAQEPGTSPSDPGSVATSDVTAPETPTDTPTDVPTDTATVETPPATDTPVVTDTPTDAPTEASPSPVPPTVLPPEPALGLLVRDLFDDADTATTWAFVPGWSVVASDSGNGLQALNTDAPLVLQKGQFGNVAVQARFLSSTGSGQLNVRENGADKYTASIDGSGVVTLSRSGSPLQSWTPSEPAAAGTWHILRLSAMDGVLRVSVDGSEVISYLDAAPLPAGDVSLSAAVADPITNPEANTVQVDDFFLWVPQSEYPSYPQPTPVVTTPAPAETAAPTAEASPTPEVTATAAPTEAAPVYQFKNFDLVPPPSAQLVAQLGPSANDDFANAAILNPATGVSTGGDTTGDTFETDENLLPSCANVQNTVGAGLTVWYTFTTGPAGNYVLSTAGSSFDTVLAVYKVGTGSFNSLQPAVTGTAYCNDDATTTTFTSRVTLNALPAGATYYVRVAGFNGAYGTFKLGIQQVGVPGAPVQALPATNTFWNPVTTVLNLTWNAPAGVQPFLYQYELQVASNATFTNDLIDQVTLATDPRTYLVTGFAEEQWYWRVRSLNYVGDASAWTAYRTFTVDTSAPNAPVLTLPAPVNGVTNLVRPTLMWQAVLGAKSYEVELVDHSVPGTPLLTGSPLVVATTSLSLVPTTVLASPLVVGNTYDWTVRAVDAAGNKSGDSTGTFTVVTAPLAAPLLTTPATNATVRTQNVHFVWKPVTNAANYELQVAKDAGFSVIVGTQTVPSTSSTPDINVNADGVFYWRVRALTATPTPGNWSAVWKFTVNTAPPVLLTPADNSFTNLVKPTLMWKAAPGATKYKVTIATTSDLSGGFIIQDQSAATTSLALSTVVDPDLPLKHGVKYYWSVKALDAANNESVLATPFSFTIDLANTPANGAALLGTAVRPTFTWAAAGVLGTQYKVQVDTSTTFNSNGGNPLFESPAKTTLSYTPTAIDMPVPLAPNTYYWRLLVDITGTGTFTTPGAGYPNHKFAVTAALPLAPSLVPNYPPAAFNLAASKEIRWNGTKSLVGGGFTYQLQIARTATFANPLVDQSGLNTEASTNVFTYTPANAVFTGNGEGLYYIRVRTVNAQGAFSPWSAVRTVTYDNTKPAPPILNLPANNASTTVKRPVLSWRPVTGATKYQVYLDGAGPFGGTAATSYTPASNLNIGIHNWYVVAIDAAGNVSDPSETRAVKIISAATDAPIPNRFTTGTPTVTFGPVAWTAPNGHYEVQFANVNTFTGPSLQNKSVNTGIQSAQPNTPLTNGVWYWRVRACRTGDSSQCGAWSTVGIFTVDT